MTLVTASGCGGPPLPDTTRVEGSVGALQFTSPVALYSTSEPETFTGIRNPTVLITDAAEACARIVKRPDGAAIRGADGKEVPSLLLTMGGHTRLAGDRRNLGEDFSAKVHTGGQRLPPECDGAFLCLSEPNRPSIHAESGAAFIRRVDDPGEPGSVAHGTFDVSFPGGGQLSGEFVAHPCGAVEFSSGCGQAPGASGLASLLAVAGLVFAGSRRRSGGRPPARREGWRRSW